MIVEQKITATVKIYYDFQEFMECKENKIREYMARHGWKEIGGFCANELYKGVEIESCDVFQKVFHNLDEMKCELQEIEILFNRDGDREAVALNET